jgi:hypothetical protein
MSTLGLSGPPQRTDGLWKGLFWPTIQNANDADLAATRGFWICVGLAIGTAIFSSLGAANNVGIRTSSVAAVAFFLFYLLGALGVRQASVAAALTMFVMYLLGTVVYFWFSALHFSFPRLVCLALLLTNLRAAILIRNWQNDPLRKEDFDYGPTRSNLTLRDKFVDQMPMRIWPWGKFVFYILTAVLIPIQCIGLAKILMHHP